MDFIDQANMAKACGGPNRIKNFDIKGDLSLSSLTVLHVLIEGQRGSFAKHLDKQLKRDLMFMEDKFGRSFLNRNLGLFNNLSGNILLRVLNQRIPDSGEWGGGKEFNDMIKNNGAKTVSGSKTGRCCSR